MFSLTILKKMISSTSIQSVRFLSMIFFFIYNGIKYIPSITNLKEWLNLRYMTPYLIDKWDCTRVMSCMWWTNSYLLMNNIPIQLYIRIMERRKEQTISINERGLVIRWSFAVCKGFISGRSKNISEQNSAAFSFYEETNFLKISFGRI